ncbi:hypothetical protein ACRAWF_25095 [Streptomyces sp. L7]
MDRQGRSSYDRVVRGIRLLQEPEYRHLFSGLLCTVDVANDPVAVQDALSELGPPRIDYLLPHSTWDRPPPNPSGAETPYADWLLKVFDRWDQQGRPMPVRTFESVLSTLRGGPSLTEAMGLRAERSGRDRDGRHLRVGRLAEDRLRGRSRDRLRRVPARFRRVRLPRGRAGHGSWGSTASVTRAAAVPW